MNTTGIESLIGRHLVSVDGLEPGSERAEFVCSDGARGVMQHIQDCCESVDILDVVGDVADLIDATVIDAREETSDASCAKIEGRYLDDSATWTFYIIQTNKGAVTIRWIGTSNGYYCESADFSFTEAA